MVEQSCISSHPPGVTKLNAGSPSLLGDSAFRKSPELVVPSGTSQLEQFPGTGGEV